MNIFGHYIGKELYQIEQALKADCIKYGYTLSVMDKTFPNNIDYEPQRLNVFVDDKFLITKIWAG